MDIHLRQRLDFHGEPKSLSKRLGHHDQAVMAKQAGVAIFECPESVV